MSDKFKFLSYGYEETTATARFRYSFNRGPVFEETITFHDAPTNLSTQQRRALNGCLRHLHLAAGVSYYKAYVPPNIQIDSDPLSIDEAQFFNEFYIKGLGEFAYRNNIDLRSRIQFPYSQGIQPAPSNFKLKPRTAIPVGGGKDSIVTIEALRASGEELILFWLGDSKHIEQVIHKSRLPFINVARTVSKHLLEMNKDSNVLNGHVPITGILSFITVAAAVVYGFNSIAISNEGSADEGNLVDKDAEINHQYSKSSEFESAFRRHIQSSVLSDIEYFSFLRPLSELAITSLFAHLPDYHYDFLSCNKAYRIRREDRMDHWCGDCPKCRFIFLALAPFIEHTALVNIFGKDLLDEALQETGFRELLGLTRHKPFECVGQVGECRAAFKYLGQSAQWQNKLIVKRLSPLVADNIGDINDFLALDKSNTLPDRFKKYLYAFTESKWQKNRHLGFG